MYPSQKEQPMEDEEVRPKPPGFVRQPSHQSKFEPDSEMMTSSSKAKFYSGLSDSEVLRQATGRP